MLNRNVNKYAKMFETLKQNVVRSAAAFADGQAVLVGDDGRRENEIDLVFHGEHATPSLVNLALQHGKGLLCVSVGPQVADELMLASAPQYPMQFSHTAFTLSVDAKHNIASGISATDRATTIRLLAADDARPQDFISPGHVFPLCAKAGGLLERSGHTEAALELCRLARKKEVAAIVEVLNENGEPVRPSQLNKAAKEICDLPYVTTVEILWYKILFQRLWMEMDCFQILKDSQNFKYCPKDLLQLSSSCVLQKHQTQIAPEQIRIEICNGVKTVANDVAQKHDATLFIFNADECFEPVPTDLDLFCDLSHKDGLQSTLASVRRCITLIHALEVLRKKAGHSLHEKGREEWFQKIRFPIAADQELCLSLCALL